MTASFKTGLLNLEMMCTPTVSLVFRHDTWTWTNRIVSIFVLFALNELVGWYDLVSQA